MRKNSTALIITLGMPLIIGALSTQISGIYKVYSNIVLPPLTPPSLLFPIIWTAILLLLGYSSYLIWAEPGQALMKEKALILYQWEIFFIFYWPLLFARHYAFFESFVLSLLIFGLSVLITFLFSNISKKAAYLRIPYVLWSAFACYLSYMIYLMN